MQLLDRFNVKFFFSEHLIYVIIFPCENMRKRVKILLKLYYKIFQMDERGFLDYEKRCSG